MYKLIKIEASSGTVHGIHRTKDNAYIPFSTDNTDYAEFKKAVTAGAELQDADGNVMTAEAAQAFVATLP